MQVGLVSLSHVAYSPGMVQRVAMIRVVLFAAVVLPLVGCFGFVQNPAYIPSILPAGDAIQTHAKPAGFGYYRDFDPQAHRLEVTPASSSCKLGGQQVLIATVYDKDGTARRARRVEWMIEGPGQIVEVDESGIFAGRGYKVNSKYAVSYTDYGEHRFTRGNSDAEDDFTVRAGQTWCVVTSAVPGETIVTAYAPGVFNWERGRVNTKINFGGGDGVIFGGNGGAKAYAGASRTNSDGETTSARVNGYASLKTTINTIAKREGLRPEDLRVRYKFIDGEPADFVAPPNVSGTRSGVGYLEVPADENGYAPVRVKQINPRVGKTNIGVDVLKESNSGELVSVSKSINTIEWMSPGLNVELTGPKVVNANENGELLLTVTNKSDVEGSRSNVEVRFQQGFTIGTSSPAPAERNGPLSMTWSIPQLSPGAKKEIRIPFRLDKNGSYVAQANATSEDGLIADARITVSVGQATLKTVVDAGRVVSVGEGFNLKVTATNNGSIALDDVKTSLAFGDGLEHSSGADPVQATIGSLAPNESRSVTVPLVARRTGKHPVQVSTYSDSVVDRGESLIEVRRAELKATVDGPTKLTPGANGLFEFGIANNGDANVPNVVMKATLPVGLTAEKADENGSISGSSTVTWRIGDIPSGGRKLVKVAVKADKTIDKGIVAVSASSGEPGRTTNRNEADGLTAKADMNVTVVGQPALLLEIAEPSEAVPLGRRAGYRVVVKNKGNGPAKLVKIVVELPEEYANVKGYGPNQTTFTPEGSKLIYPVLKELPAGTSYTVSFEVEGTKAGQARVRAEVSATDLAKPLTEEQTTRVLDRGR
jgi:Domain of unknown function DUF11